MNHWAQPDTALLMIHASSGSGIPGVGAPAAGSRQDRRIFLEELVRGDEYLLIHLELPGSDTPKFLMHPFIQQELTLSDDQRFQQICA